MWVSPAMEPTTVAKKAAQKGQQNGNNYGDNKSKQQECVIKAINLQIVSVKLNNILKVLRE